MFSLQIPVKMDRVSTANEDSPRASFSRWNTLNTDFTPCNHNVGIYGWRKTCLYAVVLVIMVMVIMNMAILVWIIRVMDFTMVSHFPWGSFRNFQIDF